MLHGVDASHWQSSSTSGSLQLYMQRNVEVHCSRMRTSHRIRPAFLCLLLPTLLSSESLPSARRPEDVGFSSQRLERARAQIQADVDGQRIPGAVLLIARQGKVASVMAVGFQDRK